MKTIWIAVLVVLLLAGLCVATCPDKEAHTEALKEVVNAHITAELSDEIGGEYSEGLVSIGSMIGTGIGGLVIDNMLRVDNYFVCSIGTIELEGERKVVSVGVLNHVFTASDPDAVRADG